MISAMKEIQHEKVERGWLGREQFHKAVIEGFLEEVSLRMMRSWAKGRTRGSAPEVEARASAETERTKRTGFFLKQKE